MAAAWDNDGGRVFGRILRDVAGVLDPALERPRFRPLSGPGELAEAWRAVGLDGVEETSLLIRTEVRSFEDHWAPFSTGEGPHGRCVVGMPEPAARR